MPIRLQLLLFGVIGNVLVAAIFIFSFGYRENIQEDSSNESLLTLYESAWYQTYNKSFDVMSKWLPVTGENASFWDPDSEIFLDEVASSNIFTNPLLDTISADRIGDAQYLIELFFEEDLDYGNLSYVMAYFPSGERIYCGGALDLLGVDPCSPAARPDFFSYLDSYLKDASTRPRQSIVKIRDSNDEQAATLNQALSFPVKVEGETLAIVSLGVDIRKGLEVFEDEFEVRTAINTESGLISLNDYYQQFGDTEDNLFDLENFNKLTDKAASYKETNGSRYSQKDTELGTSVTLLQLSSSLSADEAQLYVFKDERENILRAANVLNLTYIAAISFVIFIISLIAFITTRTFGGITKAIEVLEGLTKGDHTQEMPIRKGLLASERDEVGQLSTALKSYKSHLVEMESIRAEQAERRHERDEVIIEKMSALADQLDGSARTLILNDIKKMKDLADNSDRNSSEEASVELMLVAFSRMSDEVNGLIDARTGEMETARDEARDASDQKTKFFANMSHELRTPLNAILGYGEMLYEDCEDLGYDDLLPDLKKITSSGSHLLSLINNILDLSKIEAGKMELFITSFEIEHMIQTIKDVSEPLAAKNDNGFVINLDGAMGSMSQDETKLRQCLTNFLSNGFKFTKNGTVTLDVKSRLDGKIEFIDFAVIDTGAGMSAEGVAKVFEEYTQAERSTSANYGGTGLGLPISKKFAEMMGGDVVVTSEEGKGSVFTLSVPRECPEYNEDEVDSNVINLDADDNLVVLVDDDVAMHDLIKRTISKLNLTLIGATNSEKGMELIREVKPKLILLDVLMPGRDGWSLLKECKTDSELKDIPVIMISQLNQSNLAASLGANDYLTKPIDRTHFVNTIQRLLGTGGKDQKVLVIDDDKDVRELLSRLLKDAGYRPIDARDGKEGLERTKDEPALIILDLEMPRMDGFEFLDNYIKDVPEDKRAPVLVFSGKDLTDVQEDLLKERVVGLVKKDDVSMDNLSKMIQGIVKK
ncbi:MAG: response regulator [Gammaproteobacteria bacterium]|uniref:histidine kinase n=1 Tax=SAR86 cluster bacterium TaxID=2030880 RepID=A0A368BQM6_9GAMM|nr:MAG: response regulator [SAR86 cluster bacterium]|tara:strand:+ start:2300 stop:5278 length:2979 start_codon:yes stop_codon:yes gene_type:complete